MPQFQTQDTKGKKEDLASFITMITRDETPFLSSIANKKATAVYHEWQTDELAAPAQNAVAEGTDFDLTLVARPSTARIGNYSQILSKHIQVSKTLDTVSKAGRNSEFAYQMKKKGTEMKRDLEHSLVGSRQVSTGGGGADTATANAGRTFGGVQSFIPSYNTLNMQTAGGGSFVADGAANHAAATGTTLGMPAASLAQGATTSELTLVAIDTVMQRIYEEGGKASVLMMSPSEKRKFSVLAQSVTNSRRNIDESGSLRQSVELYESDFGLVKVVPNYVQGLANNTDATATDANGDLIALGGASDVIVYDPSWWSMATLRPLHTTEIGTQGDSTTSMLIEETTLECRNTFANGIISAVGTVTGA